MQLDNATTDNQIDNLLDLPTNTFILNASGWSITENVTVEKKYTLIQHLLIDEVITKRRKNLQAFCLCLQSLGIDFLMHVYSDLMKEIFVHSDNAPLTTEKFVSDLLHYTLFSAFTLGPTTFWWNLFHNLEVHV